MVSTLIRIISLKKPQTKCDNLFSKTKTNKKIDLLCWGLMTSQPLWVILCRLPEKERREIEEIVEEMKERDRGEGK